jgi:hypothetical protein
MRGALNIWVVGCEVPLICVGDEGLLGTPKSMRLRDVQGDQEEVTGDGGCEVL